MTHADNRTCNKCGETKPIAAFELQASGRPYGGCRDCRSAVKSDAALRRTIAILESRAALGDDIWSAMWTGRSRRALSAVRPKRAKGHRMKLRDGSGYISIAEFACRVAERNAAHRAASACRTYEDAQAAIQVLERDTQGRERSIEVKAVAQATKGQIGGPSLPSDPTEASEEDPFADSFGDWAPAWIRAA